jgi:hypothetical protein
MPRWQHGRLQLGQPRLRRRALPRLCRLGLLLPAASPKQLESTHDWFHVGLCGVSRLIEACLRVGYSLPLGGSETVAGRSLLGCQPLTAGSNCPASRCSIQRTSKAG